MTQLTSVRLLEYIILVCIKYMQVFSERKKALDFASLISHILNIRRIYFLILWDYEDMLLFEMSKGRF